jgi:hypothetical protein
MTGYHRDESSGLPLTHRLDTGYNDDTMRNYLLLQTRSHSGAALILNTYIQKVLSKCPVMHAMHHL